MAGSALFVDSVDSAVGAREISLEGVGMALLFNLVSGEAVFAFPFGVGGSDFFSVRLGLSRLWTLSSWMVVGDTSASDEAFRLSITPNPPRSLLGWL